MKHPTVKIFHEIQKELEKKVQKKDIMEKFGVSKYILNHFYVKKGNLPKIQLLEAKNNKIDPLDDRIERESVNESVVKAKKENIIEALEKSMGNVSKSCEVAGIERRTFWHYLATDDEFRTKYDDIKEKRTDFAESKLLAEMNDGNITAIIFYLKTKGKKRGYVEKVEDKSAIVDPLEGKTIAQIDAEIAKLDD